MPEYKRHLESGDVTVTSHIPGLCIFLKCASAAFND